MLSAMNENINGGTLDEFGYTANRDLYSHLDYLFRDDISI